MHEVALNIGLFGGTFNPIHNAHLIIAEWIRVHIGLDFIYIMPTAQPPHKLDDTEILDIRHRVAMIKLAIQGEEGFRLIDDESDTDTPAFSVDTVREFSRRHPEAAGDLYFIIGQDNYKSLCSWKDPGELSRMCRIVVARRPGGNNEKDPEGIKSPIFVDTPLINISSSMIRERIREGKSIRYLVPFKVAAYIKKHNLYT